MGKHLVSQQKTRVRRSKGNKFGEEKDNNIRGNVDSLPAKVELQNVELEAILDVLNCGGERILSPNEKKAFQLYVREGQSYYETAYAMGCSVRSVRTYVERAAQKIRILCSTRIDL